MSSRAAGESRTPLGWESSSASESLPPRRPLGGGEEQGAPVPAVGAQPNGTLSSCLPVHLAQIDRGSYRGMRVSKLCSLSTPYQAVQVRQ